MTNGPTGPNPTTGGAAGEAERAADAASQLNADLRIAIDRLVETNRLEKERADLMFNQLEVSKKTAETNSLILSSISKQFEALVSNDDQLTATLQKSEGIANFFTKAKQEAELQGQAAGELEKIQKKLEGSISEAAGDQEKIKEATAEAAVEMEQLRAKTSDVADFSGKIDGKMSSLGSKLGVASNFSNTMLGSFQDMASQLRTGLRADKLAAFGSAIQTFGIGMMAGMVDKAIELAFELDKVNMGLKASTVGAHDFSDSLTEIAEKTHLSGVTIAEAGAAMGALQSNFSAFNPVASRTNEILSVNMALLQKTGISVDQSSKSIDMLNRSMGMGAIEATHFYRNIVTAGVNIGITTEKMASDFASAMESLSQFGDRSSKVFKDMAAMSKATGIEMGKLISMAQKFDTFEGAADQAAKLNAALGTQLSAVELLNADYGDTINILRNQIGDAVGGNLTSMDRFTQLYVQQALGASSVAEAQRLINMSQAEYLSYRKDLDQQRMTQEKLEKATKELVPQMQQLQLALSKIAVSLLPIANAVIPVIGGLARLLEIALEYPVGVSLLTAALYAFAASLEQTKLSAKNLAGPLLMIGVLLMSSDNEYIRVLGGAFVILGLGIKIAGISAETSSKKFMIIAGVLSLIASIFAFRINPLFIHAFFFLAAGLLAMGLAAKIGGKEILLIGIAFALMGVGLGVVIYSMSILIDSITSLFTLFVENVGILPQIAFGMYLIAGAIGAMGLASILSLGSIVLVLAAITGIGAILLGTMSALGVAEIGTLGDSMAKIGSGMEKFASGLAQVKSLTSELKASMGNGVFAATVEGGKTSVLMAGENTLSNISSSKIEVDVKIPEIKIPQPIVNVYIKDIKVDSDMFEIFTSET